MKYSNLSSVPLFGDYSDPYNDRRGTGPVRPDEPISTAVPNLNQAYDPNRLYFCWLGHSSVFLCVSGTTVLIDPVFCTYASPVPFLGPRRFPGTPIAPAQLPPIDLVLITHNHYDHLDRAALRALDPQVSRYIVPSGVGPKLGVASDKITELGWYEGTAFRGLTVTLTPSQHGSARSPFDRNQTLWGSYVLQSDRFSVFDTGDGGFGDHFSEIQRRFGSFDLAVMECGQYNQRWHGIHMFPEESAQAAQNLRARLAIPVHWGAYVLSDHPWDDPPKRFSRRCQELAVPFRVPVLNELISL